MGTGMRRTLWGIWILLLAVLTLQTAPSEREIEKSLEQRIGAWQTADFVRNVALFAPFGWLLALGGTRTSRAMLAAAALSGGIELAQIALPGRYPGLSDVLANTLGAGLGASLPAVAGATGSAARATPLSLAWGLLAAAVFSAPGVLLRPSLPDSVYYVGWTPRLGQYWPYGGRVREARLGADRLGRGRLADGDAARLSLLREAPLAVEAVAGPLPPDLSALVTIHDREQREILLLGVQGTDLVFRLRSVADALRLEPPQWRARGALADIASGEPFSVRVVRRGRTVSIETGGRRFAALGFTGGDGWQLLLPRDRFAKSLDPWLAGLWVAGLALPLGFWARPRAASGAALAALGLALALAPELELQRTPAPQWLAAAAGLGAGVALQRALPGRLGSRRRSR